MKRSEAKFGEPEREPTWEVLHSLAVPYMPFFGIVFISVRFGIGTSGTQESTRA